MVTHGVHLHCRTGFRVEVPFRTLTCVKSCVPQLD
jgi:hypothetical protein